MRRNQLRGNSPATVVHRGGIGRLYNNRCGVDHDRRWRIYGRRRCHDNRRGTDDIVYQRSRSQHGSSHTPAMMVVMVVVARPRTIMTHRRRSAMEAPRSTMKARTRTGKHHSCRCDGGQHYYQFLVHVILLFLSLSTVCKARRTAKSDSIRKKNLRTVQRDCPQRFQANEVPMLRMRPPAQCRRRSSTSGCNRAPIWRYRRAPRHACCRRADSRCTRHNLRAIRSHRCST